MLNPKFLVAAVSVVVVAEALAPGAASRRVNEVSWSSSAAYARLRIVDVVDSLPGEEDQSQKQQPCAVVADSLRRGVAVPIAAAAVPSLRAAVRQASSSSSSFPSGGAVADRSGGLLDNLPWDEIAASSGSLDKRRCYDAVKFGPRRRSSYAALVEAVSGAFGAMLSEALIEDAWPSPDAVKLEGALRFDTGLVVECFADEAIGVAAVSKCPLSIEKPLLDAVAGVTTRSEDVLGERENAPDPASIRTGREYLALGVADKVAMILALSTSSSSQMTTIKNALPRPRAMRDDPRGPDAPLDDLLLPFVDEIVRREVLINQAVRAGDMALAATLAADKSDRHKMYDAAREAEAMDDPGAELRARYDRSILDAARADVTQDVGSYSRFLDRDPWYEEQLRRNRKSSASSSD